ncbi:MAG: P1 family peptidase [Anaerolineae bacterium]
MYNAITDVPGLKVGHYTDLDAATGCTVVLCEAGAVAGVDTRGSAPGTRETDLMRPVRLVQKVHAVVLSGGSAFGLDAACGVMRYLEERGVGFDTGVARVPIVAEAVLFDLAIGSATVRPDAAAGYAACLAASSVPVEEGCVGAGTGATVGKLFGPGYATKCGLGTASAQIGGGVIVAAIVAVNAFGDVVDPETGAILAGTRDPETGRFVDTVRRLYGDLSGFAGGFSSNTTIGVVATNARLTKEGANKVAQMAHDGFAMAIRPVHTMWDGDTIFALATGEKEADVSVVGAIAAQVMARAIVRAAQKATSLAGVPAAVDLREALASPRRP